MSLPSLASDISTQTGMYASAGLFFASAIAWMDVVRFAISRLVNVNKNGGYYYFLSALFTSLLAIFVLMALRRVGVVKNGSQGPNA